MSSFIDLSGISLPTDWYKLQISNDKKHIIYANIKLGLCSIAPVFTIADLNQIVGNILGWQYDTSLLSKQIDKLHNILSNSNQLQEDDATVLKAQEELKEANEKANLELLQAQHDYSTYDKQIYFRMIDSLDKYTEEVSLMNQLSQDLFQCQPIYEFVDQLDAGENQKLRYFCSVKVNKQEIGRGIGQNKKIAKVLASRQAFKFLSPSLYSEWDKKTKKDGSDRMDTTSDEEMKVSQTVSPSTSLNFSPQVSNTDEQQHGQASSNTSHSLFNQEPSQIHMPPLQEESIFTSTDAQIDDLDLMTIKRHLTQRYTPLTIIKSLQDKHRTISIEEDCQSYKHTLNNAPVFVVEFAIKNRGISGRDENMSKARARQIAAQRFLKNLFPPGYTWLQLVALVSTSREPLKTFMDI